MSTCSPPTGGHTLPRDLAGADPRYGYGSKQFTLRFERDIDKAAYIAAQSKLSRRDADYVRFVTEATGLTEPQVREMGVRVRERIKAMARDAVLPAGHVGRLRVASL